jgi:hypothetical protein
MDRERRESDLMGIFMHGSIRNTRSYGHRFYNCSRPPVHVIWSGLLIVYFTMSHGVPAMTTLGEIH